MKFMGVTNDDVTAYENKLLQEHTEATTKEPQEKALTPEEKADKNADIAQKLSAVTKNNAEAKKANADADKILKDAANDVSVTDAIGTGHIAADRLSYILARKPELIAGVMAKYPDFDSSKAGAYPEAYKQFTSTKPGTAGFAMNAGGTSLQHLNELRALNTIESRVPGTVDYQRYENKVDTVADELAKFYGNSTIPGIASYKKTLASTFNRDAAITTQAKSMGDKMDEYQHQWENARPSKAYSAPYPDMSANAKAARAAMDPDYAKRSGQAASQPFAKYSSDGKWGWNGKAWVATQGAQ
jgi:hypothetical protein